MHSQQSPHDIYLRNEANAFRLATQFVYHDNRTIGFGRCSVQENGKLVIVRTDNGVKYLLTSAYFALCLRNNACQTSGSNPCKETRESNVRVASVRRYRADMYSKTGTCVAKTTEFEDLKVALSCGKTVSLCIDQFLCEFEPASYLFRSLHSIDGRNVDSLYVNKIGSVINLVRAELPSSVVRKSWRIEKVEWHASESALLIKTNACVRYLVPGSFLHDALLSSHLAPEKHVSISNCLLCPTTNKLLIVTSNKTTYSYTLASLIQYIDYRAHGFERPSKEYQPNVHTVFDRVTSRKSQRQMRRLERALIR